MIDALRMIAGRSPAAMREAVKAIQAHGNGSPMAAQRASVVAGIALADPEADWTAEERLRIAELLAPASRIEKREPIRLTLPATDVDDLRTIGGGNVSQGVSRLLAGWRQGNVSV